MLLIVMKLLLLNPLKKVSKIKITDKKDLWYLEQILEKGDLISTKTTRKIDFSKEGDKKKVAKKSVFMTINLSEIILDGSSLKLKGKITHSSDENVPTGKFHSFLIDIGKTLKIEKKFTEKQIKLLKEAGKKSFSAKILACVIDDKNVAIAEISTSDPKYFDCKYSELGDISKKLMDLGKEIKPEVIVIASPSDLNKKLADNLAKKSPDLKDKIRTSKVSSGSKYGIKELVGSGEIKKIAKENKENKEKNLMNNLTKEIDKDMGIYSVSKVKKAIEYGAVKDLLISENFFESNRKEAEEFMNLVKKINGESTIISSKPSIDNLDNLGGIAAILRFKV